MKKFETSIKLVSCTLLFGWLLGCTTISPQTGSDDDSVVPAMDWTDGLTEDQVVTVMPVTVEPVEPKPADTQGIASTETNSVSAVTTKTHQISWQVPADSLTPSDWNLYIKTDEEVWTPLDTHAVDISVDNQDIDGQIYDVYTVTVSTDAGVTADSDTSLESEVVEPSPVTDYKVEMVDMDGNTSSTEVSIVTLPEGHPVQVTLADETNAGAPSGIFAEYNSVEETLWNVQFLNRLALPQTVTLKNLYSNSSLVSFHVRTDLSDFNFNEKLLVRSSNSSFCRVEELVANDANVKMRLKYSFEDLPLSAISMERGGTFDFNDVVLYVDVMENPAP